MRGITIAPATTTDDALDESACVADRGAASLTDDDVDDAASVFAMCGDGKYEFCIACECVDDLAGEPTCIGPCENLVECAEFCTEVAGELRCDDGGIIGSGSASSDGGLPLPPLSDPISYLCGPPDPDGISSPGLSGIKVSH